MKVYIIGAISCNELDLRTYAKKHFAMPADDLVIVKDYTKVKDFNFAALRNKGEISDVIFAQVPHSAGKHGKYSSMMNKMKNEKGYPNIITLKQMKLTISAFKKAMLDSCYVKGGKVCKES